MNTIDQTSKQAAMAKAIAAKAAKRAASPNSNISVDYTDTVFAPSSDVSAIQSSIQATASGLEPNVILTNIRTGEQLNTKRLTLVRELVNADTNSKIGAAILSIPTLAEFLSIPSGVAFVERVLDGALARRTSALITAYLRSDRSIMPVLPNTLDEFMTVTKQSIGVDISARKRFSQDSWKKYRGDFKAKIVDMFTRKNIVISFTMSDFEQCLENQAIAAIKLPKIPAAMFDKLIDALISLPPTTVVDDKGKSRTDSGELFHYWKATRYNVEQTDGELTLEDLDFA
jgi:hypothetical protein